MKIHVVITPETNHYTWAIYPQNVFRTKDNILIRGTADNYEEALTAIDNAKSDLDINNSTIQEAINTHYIGQ